MLLNPTPAPSEVPKPKLEDQLRNAIRAKHYSQHTADAYAMWYRQFVLFHDKKHPAEMGAEGEKGEMPGILCTRFEHEQMPGTQTPHPRGLAVPQRSLLLRFVSALHNEMSDEWLTGKLYLKMNPTDLPTA